MQLFIRTVRIFAIGHLLLAGSAHLTRSSPRPLCVTLSNRAAFMDGADTKADLDIVKLFDFDANLLHEDFVGRVDSIVHNANEHGIFYFGVPGTTLQTSRESLSLSASSRFPSSMFIATCGVHPYHAESDPFVPVDLLSLASSTYCLAIGECGLDYTESFPARDIQLPCFEKQVVIARELQKPLYLHVRAAHDDFVYILKKNGYDGENNPSTLAVHCFTGSAAELQEYVALGCYIGLTGYVINKLNEAELKGFLSIIPPDKLLIETDAPYMGFPGCLANFETDKKKQKKQKYPNVPSALPFVLDVVSSAAGVEVLEMARVTTRNAKRFFRLEIS